MNIRTFEYVENEKLVNEIVKMDILRSLVGNIRLLNSRIKNEKYMKKLKLDSEVEAKNWEEQNEKLRTYYSNIQHTSDAQIIVENLKLMVNTMRKPIEKILKIQLLLEININENVEYGVQTIYDKIELRQIDIS